MQSVSEWWMWPIFLAFVLIMLSVDMFLLGHKKNHHVSTKEALTWTTIWISSALLFNLLFWWYLLQTTTPAIADEKALEFFTGYLIEKSLSIDNVFVFLMIFSYFNVSSEGQRRVLLYGVLGAIILRLAMILGGVWLVTHFHWILYVFGAFLAFTGIKMLAVAESTSELNKNPFLLWMQKHLRVTTEFHGEKFFVRINKLLYVTPLFLVLILIELSDVIFAVDSIPAIFAITEDPFIIFSSNIFAILGLRAMYFLLADMAKRFHLLKYGLALVLIFIGVKMLIAFWFQIPILIALAVVATILACSVIISWLTSKKI